MGIASVAGFASSFAGAAVDAYRARLQAQMEQRRLGALQFSILLSGSLAAVGMAVDTVALHVRVNALQQALAEAGQAGDVAAAEALRSQLSAVLEEPAASTRLMSTLADYIPALVAQHNGRQAPIIEGDVV